VVPALASEAMPPGFMPSTALLGTMIVLPGSLTLS